MQNCNLDDQQWSDYQKVARFLTKSCHIDSNDDFVEVNEHLNPY